MWRRVSSSSLTPLAMTSPLPKAMGGLGAISFSILAQRSVQALSLSPAMARLLSEEDEHISLMGAMALSASMSCTISLGVTRSVDTRPAMRSRSPICCRHSSMRSRSSGWRKKYSTTSWRCAIFFTSLRGKTIHRRSSRAPMGLTVLSMTVKRLVPSSFIGARSSRLRVVKRSRRTYRLSSICVMLRMWETCVCCVCSR